MTAGNHEGSKGTKEGFTAEYAESAEKAAKGKGEARDRPVTAGNHKGNKGTKNGFTAEHAESAEKATKK